MSHQETPKWVVSLKGWRKAHTHPTFVLTSRYALSTENSSPLGGMEAPASNAPI